LFLLFATGVIGKFATRFVDTRGKFAAGIVDTDGKFATSVNNTSKTGGKFASGV
jgi:hypothetical protein